MSRTQPASWGTKLNDASRAHHLRVWFGPPGEALVDLSDYLLGAIHEQSVNELVDALTLSLDRSLSSSSLSPLMTADPPVNLAYQVVLETAVTSLSTAPVSADWFELFRGTVREIDFAANPIRVVCQDLAGTLQELYTEPGNTYATGTALETAMQSVLDDASIAVTLDVPVSPAADLAANLEQSHEPVLQAERALAESIGWQARYWWNETDDEFQFSLLEPPRDKTVPDWTTSSARYLSVPEARLSKSDIRNHVTVYYGPTLADGTQASVVEFDQDSIDKYGLLAMVLREGPSSPIQTEAQARALALAAISDLSEPDVTHSVVDFDLPHIQLWDLIRFTANNVHYNTNQDLAVQAIRREYPSPGVARITLGSRGKPSAGTGTWKRRAKFGAAVNALTPVDPALFKITDVEYRGTVDGIRLYAVRMGARVTEARVYWFHFPDPLPELWFTQLLTIENLWEALDTSGDEFTVREPEWDEILKGIAVPVGPDGQVIGDGFEFDAKGTEPPIVVDDPTFTEAADGTETTFSVAIEDVRGVVSGVDVFLTQPGDAETGPFAATLAAGAWSYDIALHPDHPVIVRARVNRNDGGDPLWLGPYSADTDKVPGIPTAREQDRTGDQVTVYVDGVDTDTATLWRREVVGGTPGAETLIAARSVDPRFGSFTVTADPAGERLFRIYGKNSASVVGPYFDFAVAPYVDLDDLIDGAIVEANDYAEALITPLGAIIRSASAPTVRPGGSALDVGDMWIDTDDDDNVYTWDGDSWEVSLSEISAGRLRAGTAAIGVLYSGKIVALEMEAAGTVESTNFVAGTSGWRLEDDTAEFNDVVIRGLLESINYDPGVDGWHIDPDGSAELNDVTIRGTVAAGTVIASGEVTAQHFDLIEGGDIVLRPGEAWDLAQLIWKDSFDVGMASLTIAAGVFTIASDEQPMLIVVAGDLEIRSADDLILRGGGTTGGYMELRDGTPASGATNVWIDVEGVGMVQIKRNAGDNTLYVE